MSNNIKYDIFLSYEAEIRESILKLYEKLTKVHGLKVWLDYYSVTEESYENSEITKGISDSSVFVCCITRNYVNSRNCIREISYADNKGKKMEVLMFERLLINDLGEIGFIIGPLVRHNVYKSADLLHTWSGDIFDVILKSIMGQLSTANGFSPKLTDLPVKKTAQDPIVSSVNVASNINAGNMHGNTTLASRSVSNNNSHTLSKPDEPVHEVVLYNGELVDRVERFYQHKGETKKYYDIEHIRKEKINIDEPYECRCHKCNQTVMTRIEYTPSGSAWCCCMLLLLSGCCSFGCCLWPFFEKSFKNVSHYCSKCNALIDRYDPYKTNKPGQPAIPTKVTSQKIVPVNISEANPLTKLPELPVNKIQANKLIPISSSKMNSDILTADQERELKSLIGFEEKSFSLLWRGSRDGFGSNSFHSQCDNKGKTLTVVKSVDGSIFGGYTTIPWVSSAKLVSEKDEKSFLFTLTNPSHMPLKILKKEAIYFNGAVLHFSAYGPTFGNWEFYVAMDSNLNAKSVFKPGPSFGDWQELKELVFLQGGMGDNPHNFRTENIEVFLVD